VEAEAKINLKEYLAECSTRVERVLESLAPPENVEPQRLHSAIRWSLLAGGKRFRPALVFAGGQSFGVPMEKLDRTAAAVEMIHTYSLIHDDLPDMDNDDFRRGRETCHKKFDPATAILAGDVLEAFAFQAIAEDEILTAEKRVRLISEMARAAGTPAGMVAGQQLDLEGESKELDIAGIEAIHRAKTGAMIRFSAAAGAIIAGASKAEMAAINEYGAQLGLLFQITDDILDETASAETLGKTPGKDREAQKSTYLSHYGLAGARARAEDTYRHAILDLEKLERETSLLAEIAAFILHRES
jgi:geranylgeranyl pyrophosphate synthase